MTQVARLKCLYIMYIIEYIILFCILDALTDRMVYHNGMQFSTYDQDNDLGGNTNCAVKWKCNGWWYKNCVEVCLNAASDAAFEQGGPLWYFMGVITYSEIKVKQST